MKTTRLLLCLLLSACATSQLPSNATNAQRAAAAISDAEKGAQLLIGPGVTAYLITIKDPVKRAHAAAMVYTVSVAVNSAATGQTPTEQQLHDLIVSFGNNDPTVLQLAELVSSTYGQVVALFPIAGYSPAKFLAAIALTAQNAAHPFLAP